MKRFYPHFLNSMNWVLAGLLTLLGFSCSDSDDDGGGQVEEYGCPHANYEIKGKVVNRPNNPSRTIQIALSHPTDSDHHKPGAQYAPQTSTDSHKHAVYENGSGWYEGKAKQEITITMNEQINTEE